MIRNHWFTTLSVALGSESKHDRKTRKGGSRKTLVPATRRGVFHSAHRYVGATCDQVAAARQPDHEFH